jgi:Ca2+-binding RTX toxin-like protein
LSATSSNTDLVADANIVFGGNNSVRTVTVTPTPNQFGMTTITVTVTDPAGATVSDTFDLTFNSVNDLPTITDIANQTVEEDTPTSSLPFTIDDIETSTGTLTVIATSTDPLLFPTNRILLVGNAGNRTVTLTPGDNEFGSATITLTVTDLDGATASTSFDVTVNGGNDDPTISNIADQMTDEDIPIELLAVTIGDDETATGSLTLSATSSNPSVVPLGNIVFGGAAANRTVTISPESNASGTSTITITVEDEEGSTASTTFDVEVADLNDSPIVSQISDQLININTMIDSISLTISDVETPVDSLTIMIDSSNTALIANDAITINGSGNDRSITITPTADQVGLATITINVADTDGATTTRTFDVTVNSLPTITEIADQMIDEDESTGALDFSVTDLETAAGSLQITLETTNIILFPAGSIVIDGTGSARTVTATPHPNRSGASEITITVDDGFGGIVTESFEVTVIPFNDSPVVSAIGDQTTNEDQPIVGVEFTVSDGDSPAGLLTLEATSSNQTLITDADIGFGVIAGGVGDGANRTISLFPRLNQSGTATITVTVSDPQGATATTTFDFTVSPFNDAPQISGIADQEIGESSSTIPIDFTVNDPETGPDGITITVSSNNSVLVPESSIVVNGDGLNRTVTVTPVADHIGRAEVTLTATGPDAAMTTETFVINVTPVIGDLVFDAPIDNGPNTILLRRDGSILQVIDEATGQVVASRRLGSTIGIIINGAANEDDQLTVDLKSGGLILVPAGIQFNGGDGGNDVLIIAEADFATVTYAATGADNGSITFEAIEEIIEIAYTGLEPIIDNSNADDRIFQDIPGSNSQIRLLDDSIPNNNKLTIDANGSGGFESVTFVSPRVTLTINAGDGDDLVQILPLDELFAAALQVNGGSGNDILDASTTDRSVTLAGEEGTDSILGGRASDRLDGGADADTVKGGPADDTIHGDAGDDVLRGQAGRDQIFGDDGDDRAFGGSGSDMLNGGEGNDRLFGQGGTNDSLTGGVGNDMLNGGAGRDWVVAIADEDFVLNDFQVEGNGTDALVSIERADITGGDGDNRIDATQFSGKTILSGAGGDDTLIGSDQNDTINGGDGNDVIAGNRGRDQLFGDAGNDTINGGFGRDTIRGGAGNDGLEGSRGNDKISGNAGDDTILGGENNDSLFGGGGDDIVIGGSGSDKLSGQGGDFDTLVGGSGIGPDPGDQVDGDETEIDETFTFFADWVDATV